jgi:hypothetical protein
MPFDRNRLVRGVAVAVVALLLIAGAALAAGGILTPLAGHVGTSQQTSLQGPGDAPAVPGVPEAAKDGGDEGQGEVADTPEPAETPETVNEQGGHQDQEGATEDQGGKDDQAGAEESTDTTGSTETTDDHGGSKDGGSDSGSEH